MSAAQHTACDRCGHPPHPSECGHPITETIRDDVGIFAAPTGLRRTLIVDICDCTAPVDPYVWEANKA